MSSKKSKNISIDEIAKRIKRLREAAKLSVNEAYKRAKISRASWYNLETGKTKKPQMRNLRKICSAFGVDLEWILEGTGNGPPEPLTYVDPGASFFSGEGQIEWGKYSEAQQNLIREVLDAAPEIGEDKVDHLLRQLRFLRQIPPTKKTGNKS